MKALARDLGNSQGEKLNPRRSRWQLTALIQKPKPQKIIMSFGYLSSIRA